MFFVKTGIALWQDYNDLFTFKVRYELFCIEKKQIKNSNNNITMKNCEKVKNYYEDGYNCAQAMLAGFGEEYGLSKDLAFKIAKNFGAGCLHRGEICGAISGALLVYGLRFGSDLANDELSNEIIHNLSKNHINEFEKMHGSVICEKLLGYNIGVPEDLEKIREQNLFKLKCPNYVKDSAMILYNQILKADNKQIKITQMLSGSDLSMAIEILNKSHQTIAVEFGFTKQNNPTNNAFIDEQTLRTQLSKGIDLYVMSLDKKQIACIAIEKSLKEVGTFYIEKVSVIPEYRHRGYGEMLMDFATKKIKELGGKTISIALIDSNTRLKKWYNSQGFIETGTKDFNHLPFRVCFMSKNINM